MIERKYLPTLPDLIDRLSIVLMKRIFIVSDYKWECDAIMHDIDLILNENSRKLDAGDIYSILVLMLANRFIWENESDIRKGGGNSLEQLRATHSINGIRNHAKNTLLLDDERLDAKIDCLASDLPPEFGNWDVL
jgi:hypothetical protein